MTRLPYLTLALCALCIQACTADDLVREPSPSPDQARPDLPANDAGPPDMVAAADMPPPQDAPPDMPPPQDMPADMAPSRDFGRRCAIGPEDSWTASYFEQLEPLRGCGVVVGTLSMQATHPTPFAPLEELVILEGGLVLVQVAGWGGSLQGLERLEEIQAQDPASGGSNSSDGLLKFSRIDVLGFLKPLSNLRRIEGELRLIQMFVPSLEGLENLKSTGGLVISRGGLRDLSGLSGLEHVKGDFLLETQNFEALRGLDALKRIDGDVLIQCSENVSRRDIEAFLSGIEVGGKVTLEDC